MASRHEILCVNKTDRLNPHERITHFGGRNNDDTAWRIAEAEAITGIKTDKWTFYISRGGYTVNVIAAVSRFGHKYLKTVADGEQPDNLLSLPECR